MDFYYGLSSGVYGGCRSATVRTRAPGQRPSTARPGRISYACRHPGDGRAPRPGAPTAGRPGAASRPLAAGRARGPLPACGRPRGPPPAGGLRAPIAGRRPPGVPPRVPPGRPWLRAARRARRARVPAGRPAPGRPAPRPAPPPGGRGAQLRALPDDLRCPPSRRGRQRPRATSGPPPGLLAGPGAAGRRPGPEARSGGRRGREQGASGRSRHSVSVSDWSERARTAWSPVVTGRAERGRSRCH